VPERSQAPTYRVAAFRRAAETVSALEVGELERLATNKRLCSLKGIGEATQAVILEALAGKVPGHLAKLEAEPKPLLLPAIRSGDHASPFAACQSRAIEPTGSAALAISTAAVSQLRPGMLAMNC
jgi:hypothetical protein